MNLQCAQYFYKIKYDNINSLFLLPKPDGGNMHFLVIFLAKPICQKKFKKINKYQSLVIETHNIETTIALNLTEEECQNKYGGQLSTELTMPLCNIMAKMMKVLSHTPVFVPKFFTSSRGVNGLRCALNGNDGILYPLAESFIFIHKPTIKIRFDFVTFIRFRRAESSLGGSKFDIQVHTKSNTSREYIFTSIDKADLGLLYDFLASKDLRIAIEKRERKRLRLDDNSREEDDEGASNGSGNNDRKNKKNKKKRKKDPNAPKKPKTAFFLYSDTQRANIKAENPEFSYGDIGKEIGRRWKVLEKEGKEPFESDAKRLAAEYDLKLKAYKSNLSFTTPHVRF